MTVPDRGPGTGTNYEKRNGTTFLDFPLFLGIFQWDKPTKRVPFTAEPEIPEILSKYNGKRPWNVKCVKSARMGRNVLKV